jgi:hypothetical protein
MPFTTGLRRHEAIQTFYLLFVSKGKAAATGNRA